MSDSRVSADIIRRLLLGQYPHLLWHLQQFGKLGDDTSRAELGSSSAPTAISTNLTLGRDPAQASLARLDIRLQDSPAKPPLAAGPLDFNHLEDSSDDDVS